LALIDILKYTRWKLITHAALLIDAHREKGCIRMISVELLDRFSYRQANILERLVIAERHGDEDPSGSLLIVPLEDSPKKRRVGWEREISPADPIKPDRKIQQPPLCTQASLLT
jgi:hypothetical protein